MFRVTWQLGSVGCKSEERVEQFANRDITLDGKYFVSKVSLRRSSFYSTVTQVISTKQSAITISILHPLKFLAIF